ncbi:MAG: hypothetical protein LBP55_00965 [Candidatus Adiutrix sp.]|jgi:hypothetical protein|nr:hypothetical protein [Candidatus Adiutrix sp.]
MITYKSEEKSELLFEFPDELKWEKFDKQGLKMPVGMKLVDLVIERDTDVLLIEIKDPSHSKSPHEEQNKYFKRLLDDSVLTEDLTPKARDSYLFLHLMERDVKPFKYIVLIGLSAFDQKRKKALLSDFKNRLMANIRCESHEPWKRRHIADCVVLSVETWNKTFPDWPVKRLIASQSSGA